MSLLLLEISGESLFMYFERFQDVSDIPWFDFWIFSMPAIKGRGIELRQSGVCHDLVPSSPPIPDLKTKILQIRAKIRAFYRCFGFL
jgi:hypothetical protein